MRINRIQNLIQSNKIGPEPNEFKVVNLSSSVTELYIYDYIDKYGGVSAEHFIKILNSTQTDEIHIRVNSPGGSSFDARSIAAAINSHASVVTAKIDGLCASAATTIVNACDAIDMADGAMYMIHNSMIGVFGNKHELLDAYNFADKVDNELAKDYASRTGIALNDIKAMMDKETWFTATEALESGFITSVLENVKAIKNNYDLSVFNNAPKRKTVKNVVEKPVLFKRSKYERLANTATALSI